MAKWDIKDWFWWLNVEVGAKWNIAYVLPQGPVQSPLPFGTHITPDGVGGVTSILLLGIGDSTKHGSRLLKNKVWNLNLQQIHTLRDR
jgi:hypothetical protein